MEQKEVNRQIDEIEELFDKIYNTLSRDYIISAEVMSAAA